MIALARLAPEGCDVPDIQVRGVALDSRRVTAGCLFLALQGDTSDGHDFISAAVANGAAAVFAQRPVAECEVPLIVVSDLATQVSQIAGEFFGHPSRHFDCVAVTGTNGKTSVAHFTAELAAQLGIRAGFLGTTGWGALDVARDNPAKKTTLQPATLTTADAVLLQERLYQLHADGVQLVALELSSHALQQHRGDALGVDVALFTNLSRDHLDYHGNMANYGAAKARLFEFSTLRGMALNGDDAFGATLSKTLVERAEPHNSAPGATNTPILSLVSDESSQRSTSLGDTPQQLICMSGLTTSGKGMSWDLSTPWGDVALSSQVIGRYNAANISLAVAALALLGHDLNSIAAAVPQLQAPAGRLQRVGESSGVFVDYAHTPDALETVLQAARAHCAGKLICVFGCGGDRDTGKRGPMGRAVMRFADLGWLTSDNPRYEDPAAIIADVEAGLSQEKGSPRKIHSVLDRREAIAAAIAAAEPDDVVIIAGKGHEDYQDIQGVRHPFDDALVAQAILAEGAR